jgi:hypothetical protein
LTERISVDTVAVMYQLADDPREEGTYVVQFQASGTMYDFGLEPILAEALFKGLNVSLNAASPYPPEHRTPPSD